MLGFVHLGGAGDFFNRWLHLLLEDGRPPILAVRISFLTPLPAGTRVVDAESADTAYEK